MARLLSDSLDNLEVFANISTNSYNPAFLCIFVDWKAMEGNSWFTFWSVIWAQGHIRAHWNDFNCLAWLAANLILDTHRLDFMPKVHTSYPIWLPCDKGECSDELYCPLHQSGAVVAGATNAVNTKQSEAVTVSLFPPLPPHLHAFNPITPTHRHFVLSPVLLTSRDQDGGQSDSTIDIYDLTEK